MVGSTPIASGRQNDEGDGICGHGVGDTERVERREAERAFIVVPLCGGGRHSQAKPPPPSRPPSNPSISAPQDCSGHKARCIPAYCFLLTFDCASTCSVVWMRLLEYRLSTLDYILNLGTCEVNAKNYHRPS
jgi:hypothetical protein